jgi:hypothetical protein
MRRAYTRRWTTRIGLLAFQGAVARSSGNDPDRVKAVVAYYPI